MSEQRIGVQRSRLPFTMIENVVFEDSSLSKEAKMVYWALCYHADKEGKCWPSIRTLSQEISGGHTTVVKALKALCKTGYLTCASRLDESGDRASNLYTIKGKRKARGVTGEEHLSLGKPSEVLPDSNTGVPGEERNYIHLNQTKNGADAPAVKNTKSQSFITSLFFEKYTGRRGHKPKWTGKEGKLLKTDLARLGQERLAAAVTAFFDDPPASVAEFCLKAGWGYAVFHSQIEKLEAYREVEERKRKAERVCPHCGKAQRHNGIDCIRCGKPMKAEARNVG